MKMIEAKRKGARRIKEIPNDILEQLNCGKIETANLVEFLGIDARVLLENVLVEYDRNNYLKPILEQVDNLNKFTFVTINATIGEGLYEQTTLLKDSDFLVAISTHKSDLVRSWATVLVGKDATLNISQTLQKIKPFAADRHFNVRECAWSAVRKNIIQNLDESIAILSGWTASDDENIRRFASEATRPRGVWCEHIKELKENPELALSILEPLKSDNSKYVQNSVGNWLNDASKTQPEFVVKFCERWEKESDAKETKYIIKRALRTIVK
jgi:3-methyladenine DNA glycosylase AlkC